MANELYFGDNLTILREHIKDESVDLIYLDPPFNSSATYNRLFKSQTGDHSRAQLAAFHDTWHWGDQAASEFDELLVQPNTAVAEMMRALRRFLGDNDVMAYLTMMASRLLELRRVLKPTGSLYLHCDPTASHYLKVVMDGVFGTENFRNEVIWKRTSAHSGAKRYGPVHDVLLFYSRGSNSFWSQLYQPYDQSYLDEFYTHYDDDGRRWRRSDLTGAGTRRGETGQPWRGIDITAKGRHWAQPPSVLSKLDRQGKIHWPAKSGGMPMLKRYLDEQPGVPLQDVWTDIRPMHNLSDERLGYQTQKPLALLDRIIEASSSVGDLILDPFCGCGTAIESAHRLKRRWIGIDITNLAIDLVEDRLRRAFPNVQHIKVNGRPVDLEGARNLAFRDKYEFQYWICSLVDATPSQQRKKGADAGIDGLTYFVDDAKETKKVVLSVKGGENVSVQMIRDLRGVLEREDAAIAWFVTLHEPTKPMLEEARKAGFYAAGRERFYRIQVITVEGLLNGTERALHPGASLGPRSLRTVRGNRRSTQGELFAESAGRRVGEVVDLPEALKAAAQEKKKARPALDLRTPVLRAASRKAGYRVRGRTARR